MATVSLTAPYLINDLRETFSILCFDSLEYVTADPMKYDDEPLTDVSSAPIIPPVQDSANESFRPLSAIISNMISGFDVVR